MTSRTEFIGYGTGLEPTPSIEGGPLTREAILEANHSAQAFELRKRWNEAAVTREHTLISTCPDARLMFTLFLAHPDDPSMRNPAIEKMRYIAAAGFSTRFEKVANDPANAEILVSSHFKCGGQGARAQVDEGRITLDPHGIGLVVNDRIVSADPYLQAMHTAEVLSRQVPKAVFASVTDHETGLVKVFSRLEAGRITAGVGIGRLESGEPIEELPSGVLTDGLVRKIENNKAFVNTVGSDPEFQRKQLVQDPEAVTITTDRRPKSITTPGITDFTLGLPFNGDGAGPVVTVEDMYEIMCQTQYPIEHAARAEPGHNFFRTSSIIVETPSIDTSRALAGILSQLSWAEKWFGSGRRNLFVGQIKDGVLNQLDLFKSS